MITSVSVEGPVPVNPGSNVISSGIGPATSSPDCSAPPALAVQVQGPFASRPQIGISTSARAAGLLKIAVSSPSVSSTSAGAAAESESEQVARSPLSGSTEQLAATTSAVVAEMSDGVDVGEEDVEGRVASGPVWAGTDREHPTAKPNPAAKL